MRSFVRLAKRNSYCFKSVDLLYVFAECVILEKQLHTHINMWTMLIENDSNVKCRKLFKRYEPDSGLTKKEYLILLTDELNKVQHMFVSISRPSNVFFLLLCILFAWFLIDK